MFTKKGQTATEYMIILSVVIIIALIVVGVMGGIPGIGGSTRSRTSEAYWQTADIAISSAALTAGSEPYHTIRIRNNLRSTITITSVKLSESGSTNPVAFNNSPKVLRPGQTVSFTNMSKEPFDQLCPSSGDSFTTNLEIVYTDSETGASYTFTGDGNKLEGTCAD